MTEQSAAAFSAAIAEAATRPEEEVEAVKQQLATAQEYIQVQHTEQTNIEKMPSETAVGNGDDAHSRDRAQPVASAHARTVMLQPAAQPVAATPESKGTPLTAVSRAPGMHPYTCMCEAEKSMCTDTGRGCVLCVRMLTLSHVRHA